MWILNLFQIGKESFSSTLSQIVYMDIFSYILVCFNLQLSFQMWTNQLHETLNWKKHGDDAFRSKDFGRAIDFYTKVY